MGIQCGGSGTYEVGDGDGKVVYRSLLAAQCGLEIVEVVFGDRGRGLFVLARGDKVFARHLFGGRVRRCGVLGSS